MAHMWDYRMRFACVYVCMCYSKWKIPHARAWGWALVSRTVNQTKHQTLNHTITAPKIIQMKKYQIDKVSFPKGMAKALFILEQGTLQSQFLLTPQQAPQPARSPQCLWSRKESVASCASLGWYPCLYVKRQHTYSSSQVCSYKS